MYIHCMQNYLIIETSFTCAGDTDMRLALANIGDTTREGYQGSAIGLMNSHHRITASETFQHVKYNAHSNHLLIIQQILNCTSLD